MTIIKSRSTHISPVNGCEVPDEIHYFLSVKEVTEDSDNIYIKNWTGDIETLPKTEYYMD